MVDAKKLESYLLNRFTKSISMKQLKAMVQEYPNKELWELQDEMHPVESLLPDTTYLDYIDSLTINEFYLFIKREAKGLASLFTQLTSKRTLING